jgi:Outer membrane protein beta-barrel family/CarboxypepD_reg-like domain
MKICLLTLIFFYALSSATAQNGKSNQTVRGTVVDSASGKPLAYVTVVLQDNKTQLAGKSVLSKEDGSFVISGSGDKTWVLVLAFSGYTNKIVSLNKADSNVNLGKVMLSAATKQLKEVTVTAMRPVIKRQIDGISYDVTADPETPALSALDMMRKVPLLSVDASDNILLKGSGNYKILINGKESALMAKSPSDVLRAMPATNIERIEVITTPPAKYDAEGLAGIINIITKKNADQGYNIGVNARYNSIWGPGFNVNGTLKEGKFGLSGYLGLGERSPSTNYSGGTQIFIPANSAIVQSGSNTFGVNFHYGNMELSYEFDSLNLLTGSIEIWQDKDNQSSSQITSMTDSSGALLQQYLLTGQGKNKSLGMDAAVNYQRGFKKDKNRLLTLSYKYSYSPNSQDNSYVISDTFNYNYPNYQQYNNAGNKEHTIQLDYVHPISKLTVEAGGKAIFRNNFSDFQSNNYDDSTGKYVPDSAQTNNFNYYQNIFSVYNSEQFKWDKWIAKAGLRIEHTTVNANFTSEGSTVEQVYNNLIPSVSIQRNFKSSSLNFGYTNRISRPSIYQLNPFVNKSNPQYISTGNPNLQPEVNHNFELNYSKFSKSSINIGLSYSYSKNSIQSVSSLQIDSLSNNTLDTVTLSTYQNLGSNSTVGLNFNVNFSIIKDLTVSVNGQTSHVWLTGTYNGQFYRNDGPTGRIFANIGYKFAQDWRVGVFGGIYSGDVYLQGRSSEFVFTSWVLSRTFLNKKATISLVANCPTSKYFTTTSYTSTPQFNQTTYNQNLYRSFAIRFNFKFGKLNSDIKRNARGINNDDTKGGKTSSANQ